VEKGFKTTARFGKNLVLLTILAFP